MKLYEISAQYEALYDLADDVPKEAFFDTLESLDGEFDPKADEIACIIKDLNGDREKIRAEKKLLQEREDKITRRVNWLTEYLYDNMQRAHRFKILTPRNVLSIRKNPFKVNQSGPKWKERFVEWASKNNRDDLLYFYDPEPDLKAIKAALLDGEDIPAELIQEERLDVR